MLSSNFALYADMSQRVMLTLESFSPNMEIYSIDEAFFQLEDNLPFEKEALHIRQKVKQWTGIPLSIGIAPTKTLAKLANATAKKKPDGVCILRDPSEIRTLLEKSPPNEIWGIGTASAEKLKAKRIHTAAQLADASESLIQKTLGIGGVRTAMELRSISCFSLEEEPEKRQTIVCSRSFNEKISERATLFEAIASFTSRAAEKLRSQVSLAGFLSVFIRTSPFTQPSESRSCHITLPLATDYTPELIRLAKEALERILKPDIGYKKAGVMLGDFSEASELQTDLFATPESNPKKAALMQTVDRINRRYDKETLHSAATGIEPKWRSARSTASPSFTTSWNELPLIQN
jgi:DNA polymerase V